MIVPGPATRIFLAPSTDLGRSFDGLHGMVHSQLQEDPRSGHLFLFCNRLKLMLSARILSPIRPPGDVIFSNKPARPSPERGIDAAESRACKRASEQAWVKNVSVA